MKMNPLTKTKIWSRLFWLVLLFAWFAVSPVLLQTTFAYDRNQIDCGYDGESTGVALCYDQLAVLTKGESGDCGVCQRSSAVVLGEFLAAKGTANANRIAGARAVDDFIAQAEANGMFVRGREVTFNTPFGARRMDVILENPQTGLIGGVEIKSSVGAFNRFDRAARQQFSADRWINTYGATSVGEQSGITINNTVKILWPAPAP